MEYFGDNFCHLQSSMLVNEYVGCIEKRGWRRYDLYLLAFNLTVYYMAVICAVELYN